MDLVKDGRFHTLTKRLYNDFCDILRLGPTIQDASSIKMIRNTCLSSPLPGFTGNRLNLLGLLGFQLPELSHHLETDGRLENAIQNIKMRLRNFVNHAQGDWVDHLPLMEFADGVCREQRPRPSLDMFAPDEDILFRSGPQS